MTDQIVYTTEQHAQHMEERKLLIDASRESSRTFDNAMLTFGSAVFGFSIAFIKDVAPHPLTSTLWWLAASWLLFALGLLVICLSFLFSQRACDVEIKESVERLKNAGHESARNKWSDATAGCNLSCVVLFFSGIVCWSIFAFRNLGR